MSSQEQPRTIEAQQFIVRDDAGKIRATLGVLNSWGGACLSLHDKQGVPRIYVEIIDDHPTLRFMRPEGDPLFFFGRREDASPVLGLARNDATPALLIAAAEGKDVQVAVCRADGEHVWLNIDDLVSHGRGNGEGTQKTQEGA
jgi:hypothetical protein